MGGLTQKIRKMSDSNIEIPSGVTPANFNVRCREAPKAALAWGLENNAHIKVFENFDGGGFNCYICEFKTLEEACVFRRHFGIEGRNTLWIEDVEGRVHYLNAPEEIRPAPAVDLAREDSAKSVLYVVSLLNPNWVPISMDQLGLSNQEMDILSDGARFVYGQDGTETGLESDPDS